MDDHPIDPETRLRAHFEDRLAEMRVAYAEATTWWERMRLRRRIRRLRRHVSSHTTMS